ncbi:hypothetical protein EYF80_007390 [Liparis tanakae]|uniref:Uncharacterized protein n=1 Tax=Liparis tanakae TaxID=230148 RepID=A0A4Z2IWE0_9TELE|nr:hypothetical protein EYF80_007390 [Liparis tanakae]
MRVAGTETEQNGNAKPAPEVKGALNQPQNGIFTLGALNAAGRPHAAPQRRRLPLPIHGRRAIDSLFCILRGKNVSGGKECEDDSGAMAQHTVQKEALKEEREPGRRGDGYKEGTTECNSILTLEEGLRTEASRPTQIDIVAKNGVQVSAKENPHTRPRQGQRTARH